MVENNNTSGNEIETTPQESEPNITLGDALAGVFTEPGDTFASVKNSTKKNYWLIPLLILIVVSILSSVMVMNDEELSSEIKIKQRKAAKERIEEAVKSGSLSREQADQQLEQTDKMFGGGMFMVFGIIGALFMVLLAFFFKALVYWGGLKIFKGSGSYLDMMNVLGLAGIITAIQMAVDTALAILMGKLMMNIGPVLLVSEESLGKSMYLLMANMDLINIWYLVVVGIGLAKVSNLKNSVTIPFVFVLWLVWVLLTTIGPLKMFSGG